MSEQQHGTSERPATDRAEEMLGRLGQRFTDMRANVGRALEQRAQQRQQGGPGSSTGPARPASERAQETLGDWGERVGHVAGVAGLRLRQWGARAREEAEDLWAEAQSVRQQPRASDGAAASATPPAGADTGRHETAATTAEPAHDQGPQPEQQDESAQPS